jgi:molybdenum cofactor cytidylyltransferase
MLAKSKDPNPCVKIEVLRRRPPGERASLRMTPVSIGAIVLAAGASRRMGRNKMLIRLEGEAMARRTVRRAIGADLQPVVVVIGHEPEQVRAELAGLACDFVTNPDYTGPTSTSLHRGLKALPASIAAAIVVLADMPFITEDMLRTLASTARAAPAPLVVSRYGGVFAPPLLFRRELFPELLAWHGEGCGKQVVLRHQDEAVVLDWPVSALRDLDTPEDLAAVTGRRC